MYGLDDRGLGIRLVFLVVRPDRYGFVCVCVCFFFQAEDGIRDRDG